MPVAVTRYHDFSCAHRAVNDPGPCSAIHGHNYRVHITIEGATNDTGRVIDFARIKHEFFAWIEKAWDHKLLLWIEDPLWKEWREDDFPMGWDTVLGRSLVGVSFNTSTENMAAFLLRQAQTILDPGERSMRVTEIRIEETRKCGALARRD